MKYVWIAGIIVVALVVLVVLVGMALPKAHVATRRATIAAPPDAVFAAITSVEAFPSWRSDIRKVERLPDRDGRAVWVEQGSSGRITLAIERLEPSRLVMTRIADPELPFGGTWTYELRPVAGGSEVTITENGEIYNPIFRFMARFVFGYEATMSGYLDALSMKFGQPRQAQLQ